MKSHRIGERIVVSRSGDRWMATISGAIPDWQRQSLELWLGAWGALGAMLAYGAWSFPGGERQFYLICMGFWAFFAMRGWKAVRWRRSGQEVVQLSQDGLSIRLDHGETDRQSHRGAAGRIEAGRSPCPQPQVVPRIDGPAVLGGRWGPHPRGNGVQDPRVWEAIGSQRRDATRDALQQALGSVEEGLIRS